MQILDEVCILITDGTHYSPKDEGKGRPFVTVKDMSESGLDFDNCIRISEQVWQKADDGNSAPKSGDVLLSKDGTVGKVHVVKNEGKFAALSSIAILQPNPEILDSNYLGHFLRSEDAMRQASRMKTGTALRRIILKDIKRIQLRIPSLDEQKRIAAILDKADEIKSSSKSAKEIRKQIIRNSYLDLFGDPLDPENNTVKLSEIATITMGQSPPGTSYNDEGEGIPLLNGPAEFGEQHPVEVQWTNLPKKLCQSDDILICVRGATAGRLNVADKEYCLGRGLAAIRPIENSDISNDFIIESLHFYYDYFHQKGTGSTFININKEMLSELKIPLAEKTNIQLYSKLKKNLSTGTGETIQNAHLLVNSLVQEILS
jgi:type I restriction enzyme, S subunit